MRAFREHVGTAASLPRDNVDTDVIIPLGTLMEVARADLGRFAFAPLRYGPDGRERPGFPLNRPALRGASILVAGRSFGTGSSREGAVHALDGFGIRVVVAESFGDIFAANCVKNGLLPIALAPERLAGVREAVERVDGAEPFGVDLVARRLRGPGVDLEFDVDPAARSRLLDGRDDVGRTLELDDAIRRFQARDRLRRPWVWRPAPAAPAPTPTEE